jgi:HSP20 family protein
MTLIKFKSETPGRQVDRPGNLNEFFNELFDNVLTGDYRKPSVPGVNISETDNAFHLELAAPGFRKEDFRINVEGESLTIAAEKKSEQSENGRKFTRREFAYNSFTRSFTLPDAINTEKIKAAYENGVMVIDLPKKEEAIPQPPRQISVS